VKKKILIIDDDQLILYGLQKALRQEAVEVTTASTAAGAEEELGLCPYDLCLLDIHLPDYNGLELMKIIKQICPRTRVIIMTASYLGDEELSANIQQAMENGACYFLTKPFDLGEVKEIIRQALLNEDFRPGTRFTAKAPARQTRKFNRRPHEQQMDLAMTLIGEGETRRWHTGGKTIDISEGGVGLVTRYPLRISQVLSLRAGMMEKTGIVVWSTMLEDSTCRAGVRFA